MRDLVHTYISDNLVSGFKLSNELPYDKGNQPQYLRNMKSVYVDRDDTVQEPLFDTLDGQSAVNETITVSVYLATDAKNLPSGYDSLVSTIQAGRIDPAFVGNTQKQTTVQTEYVGDALVTQFDFTFTNFKL